MLFPTNSKVNTKDGNLNKKDDKFKQKGYYIATARAFSGHINQRTGVLMWAV